MLSSQPARQNGNARFHRNLAIHVLNSDLTKVRYAYLKLI